MKTIIKNRRKRNALTLFLTLLVLAGCSSKPEKLEYYSLSYPAKVLTKDSNIRQVAEKELIVLEGVRLADFLRHQGLVMQTRDNKMHLSTTHRWAESLDEALNRVLIGHLENKLSDFRIESQNGRWKKKPTYRLSIELSHFHATENNQVITAGWFWLFDDDNDLLTKQRFYYELPLSQNGYLHAVENLNHSLEKLSDKVVTSIKEP